MKGANALRVEERIARVPADLGGPAEAETGIFEALKSLELKDGSAGGARRAAKPPRRSAAPRRLEPEGTAREGAARKGAEPEEKAPLAAERLGPSSFTAAERRAIVVSCTEYRNRLPIYLQSAKREVEIIDSILRKCSRAEREADRGPPGGGGD
jgi:hypothetical protein